MLALEKGVHVFCEKPPAVSSVELGRLATLAASQKLITAVGHNLRYATAFQVLSDTIPSESRVACDIRYLTSGPRGVRWALSPQRSFLLSHVIHVVDLLVFMLGKPDSVSAGSIQTHGGTVMSARFDFDDGRLATIVVSDVAPSFQFDAWVISRNGFVGHLDSLRSVRYLSSTERGRRWSEIWQPRPLEVGYALAGYSNELEAFCHSIRNGVSASPSFHDELLTYRLIDEIEAQIS